MVSLIGFSSCVWLFAHAWDPEFETALMRMAENQLTKYNTVEEFRPISRLTREQAAKFFSTWATYLTLEYGITSANIQDQSCAFTDMFVADPTLQSSIGSACKMGLMKGANKQFFPQAVLTKAEAATILVRFLDGKLAEDQHPWRDNYYLQAAEYELIDDLDYTDFNQPITRYQAAIMLYRAFQMRGSEFSTESVNQQVSVAADRDAWLTRIWETEPEIKQAIDLANQQKNTEARSYLGESIGKLWELQNKLLDYDPIKENEAQQLYTSAVLLLQKAQNILDQ